MRMLQKKKKNCLANHRSLRGRQTLLEQHLNASNDTRTASCRFKADKTLELVRQDKLNWHTYRATARIGHKINTFGRKVQTSTTSDSHQTKWNDDKTKEMQITDFAPQESQPSLRATLNRRRSCNSAYKKWKTFTIVVVLHRRHY